MCVIVAKEKGIVMPDKNILKTCFNHNPDGAGIMWNQGNAVHIRKWNAKAQSAQSDY